MKPRIAIPLPTSADLGYNQRSWPRYAACVELAGGEPVPIDLALSPAQLKGLADGCDGVLLPGSPADVDPALYGEDRTLECGPADPAREAADALLLDYACNQRQGHPPRPVLAICYGVQSLNTWCGGSLVQDLVPLPVNHAAGARVAVAHTAVVAENSLLASLLTEEEAPLKDGFLRLPVNSSHHQAIAAPGQGLRIVARCPEDGVIEAVELDPAFPPRDASVLFHVEHAAPRAPHFFMGIQWHPERSYDISAASRALFGRLIAEARDSAASNRSTTALPPSSAQ